MSDKERVRQLVVERYPGELHGLRAELARERNERDATADMLRVARAAMQQAIERLEYPTTGGSIAECDAAAWDAVDILRHALNADRRPLASE